jgi:uncharacterized RmlC-like cupin family protein
MQVQNSTSSLTDHDDWMDGCLIGFIELPPRAIKDAESVGSYTQVFYVAECQDLAIEFGLANPRNERWDNTTAQRMLLKKGDSFYVPAGNVYQLENHSHLKRCLLFWTIIRPIEEDVASVATDSAVPPNTSSSSSSRVFPTGDDM